MCIRDRIHPLPQGLCDALGGYRSILFAEEGVRGGGIGEHLAAALLERGCNASYRHIAVPNNGLTHASVDELRARFGYFIHFCIRNILFKMMFFWF